MADVHQQTIYLSKKRWQNMFISSFDFTIFDQSYNLSFESVSFFIYYSVIEVL